MNKKPTVKELVVMEDYAIQKKVDFNALVNKLKESGWSIKGETVHEAVGRIVIMTKVVFN